MKKTVLIIGGGFAGLAAAVALTEKGCQVTVLEKRRILGGRAYSLTDEATGVSVDNGQHVMLGCFTETLRFLTTIGAVPKLSFQESLEIHFAGPDGLQGALQCPRLPAPLHLISGLLFLPTVSLKDRLKMARVAWSLLSRTPPEVLDRRTVKEWLTSLGQSEEAQSHFWNVFAIAALNENPHVGSAALYKEVLHRAFFSTRKASCLVLSAVGLSALYADDARLFLEQRGGRVLTNTAVKKIIVEGERVAGLSLSAPGGDDRTMTADAYISAAPPFALVRLLPEDLLTRDPYFQMITKLLPSPILSIHLWFDRPITPHAVVALLDTSIQWLFNKKKILREEGTPEGYVTLVVSGAYRLITQSNEEIIRIALKDLTACFPHALEAKLLRSHVVKEKEATISPAAGTLVLRPSQRSPLANFYLAGDWTATGLPATIESAVLSGHRCADLITRERPHNS